MTETRSGAAPAAETPEQRFRATPSYVIGWIWVAFAAANLADLVLRGGGSHISLVISCALLTSVGAVYALWLRPRVLTYAGGVRVLNPFREAWVPWETFTHADVTDVLRLHTTVPVAGRSDGEAGPGDETDEAARRARMVRVWAIRETSRTRVRARLRDQRPQGVSDDVAAQVSGRTPADYVAIQLNEAKQRHRSPEDPSATPDAPVRRWSLVPLAATLVPLAVLLVLIPLG